MKRAPRIAAAGLLAAPLILLTGCTSGSTPTTTGSVADQNASTAASEPPGTTSAVGSASTASPAGQKAVAAEKNPPGDIPDNLAFIRYRNRTGRYSFTHPEGWAENAKGASVTFTDKLNGVQVMPGPETTVPSVASAKARDVPALKQSQLAFQTRGVSAVSVPAGRGVRIIYRRNSAADPVTGRQYRDEVERYELVAGGREIVMELFGPVGADNVDAYRTMVQSLRLS
jgi:hypothetical protein